MGARDLCWALNATRDAREDERRAILRELFGRGGDSVRMVFAAGNPCRGIEAH